MFLCTRVSRLSALPRFTRAVRSRPPAGVSSSSSQLSPDRLSCADLPVEAEVVSESNARLWERSTVRLDSMANKEEEERVMQRPQEEEQQEVELDGQSQHAQKVNQRVFDLLNQNSTIVGKVEKNKQGYKRVSLWKHLQGYSKSAVAEKSVLLDPAVATELADAVARKTQSLNSGVFMDGDGGCCDVTKRLLERGVFQKAIVFTRDQKLQPLHEWALKETLYHVAGRIDFKSVNLLTLPLDGAAARYTNVSGITSAASGSVGAGEGSNETWSDPAAPPPYTLFGLATHNFAKYLIARCLHRDSFLSEFYHGRPEFFLLLTHESLRKLLATPQTNRMAFKGLNVLFQLLFDYEVLMNVPRSSFFPWKRVGKAFKSDSREILPGVPDLGEEARRVFHLVWLRPKPEVGLHERASLTYLDYFVHILFFNSNVRIIPLMEKLVPGCGPMLIRDCGHDVYDVTGKLVRDDVVPMLNALVQHPNFSPAAFEQHVDVFLKSRREYIESKGAKMSKTSEGGERVQRELERLRREFGPQGEDYAKTERTH